MLWIKALRIVLFVAGFAGLFCPPRVVGKPY